MQYLSSNLLKEKIILKYIRQALVAFCLFIGLFCLSILSLSASASEPTATKSSTLEPSAIKDSADAITVTYDDPNDPFEKFNRVMWEFNYNYLDRYLVRPVAHGYRDFVPNPMKFGIDNFVRNLDEPSSMVNNLLQGKWLWASNAGGRFLVNSTLGLAGLVDVAHMMGMERKQDTFSEVLAFYGAPNGPFIMAPVFGPFTSLEVATDWVDNMYFPLNELTLLQTFIKWGFKSLNERANAIDQEQLIDNSLDSYSFVKNAFYQHLDYKIYDGDPPNVEDDILLDQYLDELE